MPRSSRLAIAAAALLATSSLAGSALGYTFKTAPNGTPLRWLQPELTVLVSTVAPEEVDAAEVMPLVIAAFAAWDVPGAPVPQVDVVGTTEAKNITTPSEVCDDGDNIVVFYKTAAQWRTVPMSTATQIALTIIASNNTTGEIIDADIALNDAGFTFTTGDDATSGVDLLAALTHEVGHFFGLDHSADADATMFANYGDPGSDRIGARTLADDDEEGVTDLYANNGGTAFDCTPPGMGGGGDSGGCHAGHLGHDGVPGWVFALVGGLGFVFVWRRRSRRHGR